MKILNKSNLLLTAPSLAFLVVASLSYSATAERDDAVIKGVNYVGVSVSNLDRTAEFYEAVAELELVEESTLDSNVLGALLEDSNISVQTKLYRSVNAQLRFMEFGALPTESIGSSPVPVASIPVAVNGQGIAHICYQVADETQSYQRFIESGASHIGNPDLVQLNPRNPVVYAYAKDPDGIMFEVEHIDFSQASRPKKNDYRIRHVSLATPDMERMVAFYSVIMEEPEPRRSGIGGTLGGEAFDQVSGFPGTQVEMAWYQVRNLELELIQYHSHPPRVQNTPRPLSAHGYNMVMFDVEDLAAARTLVESAGGRLVTEILAMDGGETFFARDPDGNLLGFQRVPDSNPFSSRNFPDNGT